MHFAVPTQTGCMKKSYEYESEGTMRLERYRRSQERYGLSDVSQSAVSPPLPRRTAASRPVTDARDATKASPEPKTAGRQTDLAGLIGVRSGDGDAHRRSEASSNARTLPRLTFKPVHAIAVILVLISVLCASLTMLVQQSINYAKQSPSQSVEVLGARGGSAAPSPGKTKGERKSARNGNSGPHGDSKDSSRTHESSETQPPSGTSKDAGSSSTSTDPGLVNINTADVTQLQTITGVGPVMAQRIVDYRAANGDFTSVDGLLAVSGIGPKTLEKMRAQVTV